MHKNSCTLSIVNARFSRVDEIRIEANINKTKSSSAYDKDERNERKKNI